MPVLHQQDDVGEAGKAFLTSGLNPNKRLQKAGWEHQ